MSVLQVCTRCHRGYRPYRGSRGRCRACRQTNTQAGWGWQHQQARASLALSLPAWCGYGCGTWLTSASPWVAAHVIDGDPTAGYVVACRSCNERAKTRRSA